MTVTLLSFCSLTCYPSFVRKNQISGHAPAINCQLTVLTSCFRLTINYVTCDTLSVISEAVFHR